MRFAVLASPDSWYAHDLARAAAADHEIVVLPFSQIGASVHPSSFNLHPSLADFDAPIVRTMPPGSLEQVVFRMDCLARHEAAGGIVINPARAIEAAVDKFLTTAKLQAAGLLTPRTVCCQTADEAMAAFAQLGGDVVLKP